MAHSPTSTSQALKLQVSAFSGTLGTQGYVHGRQALYQLSYFPSPWRAGSDLIIKDKGGWGRGWGGQNFWLPLVRLWPQVSYITMIFTSSFSSAR